MCKLCWNGVSLVWSRSGRWMPVTASRRRPATTARSDRLLKQSAPGIRAVCFKSQSPAARHGRPSTARSDELLQQSATGIRAVCFKSQSPAARHGRPSTASCHGPLWRTSATIGARNPCRLFQKSIPAARHGRPSTARSDELLQQSAPGMRAVCFKSQSRRPVTAGRPRPALTNFCNNRRQECVPFVSKVNPGGPSRPAVHGPLWRTSATIGDRNPCRLFQKSVPAARRGRPSTAGSHGPLWRTSATIGARNPCRLFQKSIPAARHGRPSRPALTNFWNKRRPIRARIYAALEGWDEMMHKSTVTFNLKQLRYKVPIHSLSLQPMTA